MRVYFIRHGQSTNNVLYTDNLSFAEIELKRSHDPQLTDIGEQQAERVAQFLKDAVDMPLPEFEPLSLTKLYVSPMIRALNTAKPIAEALDLQAEVWTDIFEIGGLFKAGEDDTVTGFPGLNCHEIAEHHPSYILPETVTEDGWWDVNHGRETPEQFMGRAIKVALKLRKFAHTDERIALVSHAAFLDSLIKAFLGQLPSHPDNLFYNHYNTGITRIDFAESNFTPSPDHVRIHYLNRVDHLPPEQRTW